MPDPYREPVEETPQSEAPPAPAAVKSREEEILELERQLAAKKAAFQEKDLSAKALASAEAPPSGAKVEKPLEQALNKETPTASIPIPAAPVVPPAAKIAIDQAAVKEDVQKFKGVEKNQQLKSLVDLAFLKGVNYAIEVARNLDSPYLMDEFHDVLIDEFRQKLVEGGKLEEI